MFRLIEKLITDAAGRKMNKLDERYDQRTSLPYEQEELYWNARNAWLKLTRARSPLGIVQTAYRGKKFNKSYRKYHSRY